MSDEEIRDVLRLSPIYDRLSTEEKDELLEEMRERYFAGRLSETSLQER